MSYYLPPDTTIPASMTEQITDTKQLEISYRTLHTVGTINDIYANRVVKIPFASIFVKYKDFLDDIIVDFKLTEVQRRDLLFKPKMLSQFLYGTPELWFELLRLNKWASVTDFKPKETIKVYDPGRLKDVLNEMMILEEVI